MSLRHSGHTRPKRHLCTTPSVHQTVRRLQPPRSTRQHLRRTRTGQLSKSRGALSPSPIEGEGWVRAVFRPKPVRVPTGTHPLSPATRLAKVATLFSPLSEGRGRIGRLRPNSVRGPRVVRPPPATSLAARRHPSYPQLPTKVPGHACWRLRTRRSVTLPATTAQGIKQMPSMRPNRVKHKLAAGRTGHRHHGYRDDG